MGRVTSFSLGDHFTSFVEAQVNEGRYNNASDVMRAALRLLEEREARMSALRAALIEGEESGPSTPFDFEAFIARKRKQKPKDRRRVTLSSLRAPKQTSTRSGITRPTAGDSIKRRRTHASSGKISRLWPIAPR